MHEDLQRISRYIAALVRRERALILGRILLQGGLLALVALVLASLAAALRWDRATATALLVVVVGIGAWVAVGVPLLRGWRATGDALRQARLAEGFAPELRGRLLTAVERASGARSAESASILGLVARKAVVATDRVTPSTVHPGRHLFALFGATVVAWLVSTVIVLVVPGGPVGTARWWLDGGVAHAEVDPTSPGEAGDRARVGDLILRYVYPDYTGLEPREVANGTGEAHGPPGTVVEVTARSAEPIEAAALVAYEEPALDAQVEDGRVVHGSFLIGADEGVWRLVTYRGGEARPSRDFLIVPEPDLPPDVTLETAADVVEVAVDEAIDLGWRARDDYGVRRVVLEIDGIEAGAPLSAPRERRSELTGQYGPRPADLKLAPGSRVKMAIAAWDNDTVSGSKAGRSRTVEVVVLGASGLDKREDVRQRELRKLLLGMLADFLVEPWPPGGTSTSGQIATWGEKVSHRYEPLDDWVESTWGERVPRGRKERLERELVARVTESGTKLVRFTQVGFVQGSANTPKSEDVQVVADLRDQAIVSVEDAILALDYMIRGRAMERVAEAAERLGDVAADVQASLAEDMSAQEMLTRLDMLERALQELMQQASALDQGGMREFLNQRGQEMQSLMEEIRKALAEGRLDEARELMERLARELEQMSQGVSDAMERQQQQGEDAGKEAKALIDELKQLEAQQRALQEKTRKLREQGDSKSAEAAEDLWVQLEKEAKGHEALADEFAGRLEAAKRGFNEVQRAKNGREQALDLREAIEARDLRGARLALEDARIAWQQLRWLQLMERGGSGNDREVGQLERKLDTIEALLDQLEQASENVDPQTQKQVRELRQQQQQLEERLQQAQEKSQEVTQQMQAQPKGMEESLEQAGDQMAQAGDDLGDGKPMQAEGAQGNAAERVREARESLEQAMRDQQAMSQPSQGQQDGESEDGRGGDDVQPSRPIEIPNPEQFKTPEQYRQELLEGMEGDVPEEYRALKKRYYEELVTQ